MRAPSFYSDPHVQFLSQVLDEVKAGLLQVPRFQRPLVWNWERRRELLRSIRDGIPIGAIMVWRTATTTIECYSHLGPYHLREPEGTATRSYLLDGVQRLSTLYGALNRPSTDEQDEFDEATDGDDPDGLDEETHDVGGFEVFVNLQTLDFCIPELDDVSEMMPLSIVFDSVSLLQFQRRLSDKLIVASDEIARAFRDYKLPIIPITTDDVDMATRTFQRINSQGVKMDESHMVHALTWSHQFDLNRQMNDHANEALAEYGWSRLERDPVLKTTKAAFGLDVYKTSAQDLSDRLKKEPSVLKDVYRGLARVARFLWEECGVPSPELVPYALQIVVLGDALRGRGELNERDRKNLRAWFWITTYGELFAGMSGDRVQLALEDMRSMLSSGVPTWTWKRPYEDRPLSRSFDFRAARAKAFVFRLADLQNEVYGGLAGSRVLADSGRRAVVQLLPWSSIDRRGYSSPSNRFLVEPLAAAALKERLLVGQLSPDECRAHLVTEPALAALRGHDFPAFAAIRLAEIERYERHFLRPLVSMFVPGAEARPVRLFDED